jgi:N-acetyl sugar amidotransferase
VRYCRTCLVPDTKPHVVFDGEGVCSACRAHTRKNDAMNGIDWSARADEFDRLLAEVRAADARFYDVLVPVSGGKDSIAQVSRVRDRDLRILAVNVDYGIKTEVGRHNLALVPNMGASLAVYRPDEPLQRRLIRLGLEDFGDPDLLSHTLLHAYPLHVAVQFQVPLVLLGENSAFEYGGAESEAGATGMTRGWFDRYAENEGRGAPFVAERYGIPLSSLRLYDLPPHIEEASVRTIFTSYYFHWDSEANLRIAESFGFTALSHPAEGTYRNYVGIDEKINRVHQYLKVLKFGYGRATDHACEDIRNGRLSRSTAKELVRAHDLEPLSGALADEVSEYVGLTREDFDNALERFRNLAIWKRDSRGGWYIPGHLED